MDTISSFYSEHITCVGVIFLCKMAQTQNILITTSDLPDINAYMVEIILTSVIFYTLSPPLISHHQSFKQYEPIAITITH